MTSENLPPPEEVENEAAALIKTLHETEKRLEEITRGEVDTVSTESGHPYVLRHAQIELRQNNAARQDAILNALPAHIAMLDAQGVIVSVNEAWRRFGRVNLSVAPGHGVGLNYLDVCDRAQGLHSTEAHQIAAGIRAVLAGTEPSFTIEYPCHGPAEQRWYLMTVTPLAGDGVRGAVVMHVNITERMRVATELRTSLAEILQQQTDLRVIIDLMPATIVFKGTDNIFRRVNQRFAHSVGRSVAEVEGKSSAEIFPQDAARYDAEDLKVTSSGMPEIGVIKSSRDRHGNEVWHQIDKVPVCASDGTVIGLVVMAQDITGRKRIIDDLRVSEKRFKTLFEQAAVGVAQTDATTGRFVHINQRFCDILGRSREELKHLTYAALTHPQDLATSLEKARQVKAGLLREYTEEKRYLRKDGSEVWANVTVSAMWAPGDPPDYFIAVAQDVTARKKLEEQFRQSQKMDAIGTLAGGIAHDFNNILAAINGYTELSRMQLKDNPDVHGYLGAVLQASNRATDLVRQILTFSRQQKIERRPIPLQPIVTEAFKLLRSSIPSTIEFEIMLKDAPVVLADATQIHQVLMNLGTNAWHAMKDRPGKLQVKLERIVVDAAHAPSQARLNLGDYARLSVSDSGIGMDPETQKRIFEPFFTTKPIGEGTGLGLAVVHGIMASHDGAVIVYSEPGEGTVFHLYFPAFAGAAAATIDVGQVPRGKGERILFVDDEELLVKLGGQTLRALGYEVTATTQPDAALAMVRADPNRFALVLTDQTMPGMTGVDLARQILQLRPELPIILLTGYGLSLTSERIKAAGIRHLLLKPTSIHSLGTAVHAAISTQSLP